ncbi:MAG: hypothetical protein LBD46_00390 [Endomicrobium sp.]|jgi:hypothetical protein|nr:hypothetical protein [Endomicrobium sp.]
MENRTKNKPNNKAFKIILAVTAAIIFLAILSIGSCIYKLVSNPENIETLKKASAADEEIREYTAFLDANIDIARQETENYKDIIPSEIKNTEFENNRQASKKYYEMHNSQDWPKFEGEEKKLGEAYLAYGNYYAALSAKDDFLIIMDVPKLSKIFVKVMMENDSAYKTVKKEKVESITDDEIKK